MIGGSACTECDAGTLQASYDSPELGEMGAFDVQCDSCGWEMYVPAEAAARSRIAKLRKIVRECSAARVDGYLVDMTTASMLVSVYAALSPANRERFGKPNLLRLVDLGWKCVK